MTDNKILAIDLDSIADGSNYSEESLYLALDHPATTANDKQMLVRYLYGVELSSDRFRLQDLAMEIRFYEGHNE